MFEEKISVKDIIDEMRRELRAQQEDELPAPKGNPVRHSKPGKTAQKREKNAKRGGKAKKPKKAKARQGKRQKGQGRKSRQKKAPRKKGEKIAVPSFCLLAFNCQLSLLLNEFFYFPLNRRNRFLHAGQGIPAGFLCHEKLSRGIQPD